MTQLRHGSRFHNGGFQGGKPIAGGLKGAQKIAKEEANHASRQQPKRKRTRKRKKPKKIARTDRKKERSTVELIQERSQTITPGRLLFGARPKSETT